MYEILTEKLMGVGVREIKGFFVGKSCWGDDWVNDWEKFFMI
jgi:hypothetical protein